MDNGGSCGVRAEAKASLIGECVKVGVRIRPQSASELTAGTRLAVCVNKSNSTVTITDQLIKSGSSPRSQTFQFDNIFCSSGGEGEAEFSSASQLEVYETIGRPLVTHAFCGYNSCLFAYGQTGSGKTYTMMGRDPSCVSGAESGIIPRLCTEIFERRARIEARGHSRWKVLVGYVEVYNERVSDLLARRRKGSREDVVVEVREHPTIGVFIEGQRTQEVSNMDEVVELIESGNRVRHTAATKMNERSSRSHAIFMLTLHEERSMQTASGQAITTAGLNSRMNLVDLAGSERVTQSEVVGQQFNEARYINLSLTTLGRVIDMLADMAKSKYSQWSTPPYRESRLTFILKDSLGGNSKTFMIATVSPSALNYEETLSTLRYASRARDIVNTTRVNEDPRARRIRELEDQMERMRRDIKDKDPVYVHELEEKLVLLEAEAQRRAADLHVLEKEREKNIIRERMLCATEAEREELLIKSTELERQVDESRRRAEYHEQMSQRLRDEHARRERELLEKVQQHREEIEGIQRRNDAEILNNQRQLSKLMADLEYERCNREDALRVLSERQEQLNNAICNSQQTSEERAELQKQNSELSQRMLQLAAECEAQQRLLNELENFRIQRNAIEMNVLILNVITEEMESRYRKTILHLFVTMCVTNQWCTRLRNTVWLSAKNNKCLHCTLRSTDQSQTRGTQTSLSPSQCRIEHGHRAANIIKTTTQATSFTYYPQSHDSNTQQLQNDHNLDNKEKTPNNPVITDEERLQRELESTRCELEERLHNAEEGSAAIQAEKERLQRELESTRCELVEKLRNAEEGSAVIQAEKERLQRELESTRCELEERLRNAEEGSAVIQAEKERLQRELESTRCELEERLRNAEEGSAVIQADKEGLQRELESTRCELEERLRNAEEGSAAIQADKERLQRELESTRCELEERLRNAEEGSAAIQAEKERLQRELESTRCELVEKLRNAEEGSAVIQADKERLQRELESTRCELVEKLRNAEEGSAVIQAEKERLQRELESTRCELEERLRNAEEGSAAIQADKERLQRELESTRCELEERLRNAEEGSAAIQAEKERLQRELESTRCELEERLRNVEGVTGIGGECGASSVMCCSHGDELTAARNECAVLNVRLDFLRRKVVSVFVPGEESYSLTRSIINSRM